MAVNMHVGIRGHQHMHTLAPLKGSGDWGLDVCMSVSIDCMDV